MYHLITVGDIVIDTHVQIPADTAECRLQIGKTRELCLDYGSKIPIENSFQSLGGNAANVAVGAVRLGLKTAIVSTVGQDANGQIAIEELKKQKVNTNYIHLDATSKSRYSIVLNYLGERTIFSYSDRKRYKWPRIFSATDWMYYTSHGEGFETLETELLQYLKKYPTTKLAMNPGSHMLKYALGHIRLLLPHTDLLLVNLEEAEKIAGIKLVSEKDIPNLIRSLLSLGAKEVALTDAERGAYAGTVAGLWHLPIFPVKVVAKTGAGDAFSIGYLAARMRSHDIPQALRYGIGNSASVVAGHGSQQGLLTKPKLDSFIEGFPNIVAEEIL